MRPRRYIAGIAETNKIPIPPADVALDQKLKVSTVTLPFEMRITYADWTVQFSLGPK